MYENDGGAESFEDKDMAYDDLSEADYIQYNRRAIKKSDIQNRKFRIKTKPNWFYIYSIYLNNNQSKSLRSCRFVNTYYFVIEIVE